MSHELFPMLPGIVDNLINHHLEYVKVGDTVFRYNIRTKKIEAESRIFEDDWYETTPMVLLRSLYKYEKDFIATPRIRDADRKELKSERLFLNAIIEHYKR